MTKEFGGFGGMCLAGISQRPGAADLRDLAGLGVPSEHVRQELLATAEDLMDARATPVGVEEQHAAGPAWASEEAVGNEALPLPGPALVMTTERALLGGGEQDVVMTDLKASAKF